MTPEIDRAFAAIKSAHGQGAIERVERMMNPRKQDRHPLQKGAKWVLPGVSKRPWHDPYEHAEIVPIVRALEESHAAIRAELERAWETRRAAFGNYQHYLVEKEDWKALYLYRKGAVTAEARSLVPLSTGVIEEHAIRPRRIFPLLESHFSTLLPGAVIPPHCDLWNFSINLHFAVDIPPSCAIRVGGEERTWQEGKCLLFDYSFLHEAWNRSDRPRTCLLVDLWHPEVTLPEREAIVALVTEIRKMLGEA